MSPPLHDIDHLIRGASGAAVEVQQAVAQESKTREPYSLPCFEGSSARRAREGQGVGDGSDDGDEEVRKKIRRATISKLR
jgi:hypothetical protein